MNQWASVIALCKENNRFAQNRLYEGFAGRLLRLCFRYLPQKEEAEEALMNGFLKFFKNIEHFEYNDDTSLERWLRRIMVNESLMLLRDQRRLPTFVDSDDVSNEIVSHDTADFRIEAEALFMAIVNLPAGYRTIFNLFVIEGYSHSEIAQQLGIAEGTSKSQLSKARALLQERLIQQGYEQQGKVI